MSGAKDIWVPDRVKEKILKGGEGPLKDKSIIKDVIVDGALRIDRRTIKKEIIFDNVTFRGGVFFSGCNISNLSLGGENVEIGGNFVLRKVRIFGKPSLVITGPIAIEGPVVFHDVLFEGEVRFSKVFFQNRVWIEKTRFQQGLAFLETRFGHVLDLASGNRISKIEVDPENAQLVNWSAPRVPLIVTPKIPQN